MDARPCEEAAHERQRPLVPGAGGAAPTTELPAGTAAAPPAAYNASTAQESATALVHLLMEQMGFGPDGIAPGDRAPAGEPGRRSQAAEDTPGTSGLRGRETA